MKSMKGLSMNKMLGSIRKKTVGSDRSTATTPGATPEVTAHNSVKAFCESGGSLKNDEVLFLPPIVDAAESSPTAAAESARIIRKYLAKEYSSRPSWQYNAIMLMRILADNPGETFTRSMDAKFVDTARALLKGTKDSNVRQILMDTLEEFERAKFYDTNLTLIISMWQEEKEKAVEKHGSRAPALPVRPTQSLAPDSFSNGQSQNYFSRHHNNNRLPEPAELASRLQEARESAKLLEQLVMNTPAVEILGNELIREFSNRCLSASRSIQGYMVSSNPAPDNDTMESLIDTNEQLQTALSQHQRAMLSARKQLGLNGSENPSPAPEQQSLHGSGGSNGVQGWQPPKAAASSSNSSPPPVSNAFSGNGNGNGGGSGSGSSSNKGKGKDSDLYSPPSPPLDPGRGRAPPPDPVSPVENPFSDPPQPSSSNGQLAVPFDGPFQPGFGLKHHQDGSSTHGTTGSGHASESHSTRIVNPDYQVSDDEDLYSSAPRSSKEPMYRY
ncbi:hypothetical protein FP744_10001999 [Trichoderma asperellum]|nr:hypothetical protein LI328DRAFT_13071 [Trichoderma asperelloides]